MRHQAFCDRFFPALAAGDFAAMAPMVDPDFVVYEADGLPYAGTYRGLDGWRKLSRAVVATWAEFKFHALEFPGDTENSLVVRFAISGRSRKTGKTFETTVLELWRFRHNRLCEIVPYYWDTRHLAEIDGALTSSHSK